MKTVKKRLLSWALVWDGYPWWQLVLGIIAAMLIIIGAGLWISGVNPNESFPAPDMIVRIDVSCDDPSLNDVTFAHPSDIDWVRNNVVIYSRYKLFNLAVVEEQSKMTVTFTLSDGSQFVVDFGNESVCINGDYKMLKNEPGKSVEQLTRRIFKK